MVECKMKQQEKRQEVWECSSRTILWTTTIALSSLLVTMPVLHASPLTYELSSQTVFL